MKAGELLLRYLAAADGVVLVSIASWEDVQVTVVVVVILITDAETLEGGTEDGRGEEESGEDGVGCEKHFWVNVDFDLNDGIEFEILLKC